jgi:lysophospholipase L1-like esterase
MFKLLGAHLPRLLVSLLISLPLLWANAALDGSASWNSSILVAVILSAIDDKVWVRIPRLPPVLWRGIAFLVLGFITLFFDTSIAASKTTSNNALLVNLFLFTLLVLFALSLIYRQPNGMFKLAGVAFGIVLALVCTEIVAGILLSRAELRAAQTVQPTPIPPTSEPSTPVQTIEPTSPSTNAATDISVPSPTPSATPDPKITPTPERPVAGVGHVDWIVDNGQAEWSNLTGYGPRVNSVAHAYMYDQNGSFVYDTKVEFNGKGYRGPEATYEKTADTYRILIVGDSFVEGIQVDYPQTFQALLQTELSKHNSDKRKYEVIAMGRMGWGTLQEYLYYQAEGYKYHADLVILMFYINDVADNDPAFFYPGINNTNFDYAFDAETVRIVDTNKETLPPNAARRLFNALPPLLKGTNLARFAVRIFDPPISVLTPGGVLTRVHPQFYIYVTSPEMEGYPEAWKRTAWGLTHFAKAVNDNGAKFAVAPIFIGAEMVQNVSGWYPELTKGWKWDPALPDQKLTEILKGQPATLIPTRPHYEKYAKQIGGEVYNILFLKEDGHFNAQGHKATADLLYNWLIDQKIVSP